MSTRVDEPSFLGHRADLDFYFDPGVSVRVDDQQVGAPGGRPTQLGGRSIGGSSCCE